MREVGLEPTQLGAFNDLMWLYEIAWPRPDREKAEQEGEIVAEAITRNAAGDRIEIDPKKMGGKPVIRGTRIPVELIVRKLAEGLTEADLLEAYPDLKKGDAAAAVAFWETNRWKFRSSPTCTSSSGRSRRPVPPRTW